MQASVPKSSFLVEAPLIPEKLGKLLVNAQLITEDQLQKALLTQKKEGGRIGSVLVRLGFIEEAKLLKFLSQQYGTPAIDLSKLEVDQAVVKLVPSEVVKKYLVVPVKRMGATLTLAMVDPSDVFAIDDIKFMTGYNVEPVIASESSIVEVISKYYGKGSLAVVEKTMVIEAKDYTLSEEDSYDGNTGREDDNA